MCQAKSDDMKLRISILLVLVCLLTSCIKEKQAGADLGVGDRIPDFEVTLNDGRVVSGAQLSDGVCCIVFFTTGCSDCRLTLPHIQKAYDEYSGKGVQFVLISREDDATSVDRYWIQQEFTMPYSAQSDRRIYELFARTRVPRVYICHDGIIKSIFTDQPSNPTYEALSAALEEMTDSPTR